MILTDIKKKLEEIDSNVFYGMVDKRMKETTWDYIVFNRKIIKSNTNKTGFSVVFSVNIVRENFIPEDLEIDVINKVQELAGVRLAGDGIYTYIQKPNTNIVVEMFSVDFVRAKKV